MIYSTVGPEENMEWPEWADCFVATYMAWSDIKTRDDVEFGNIGKFIKEENIPLTEFKEVITSTYSSSGLQGMETHFIFGWAAPAERQDFISRFEKT